MQSNIQTMSPEQLVGQLVGQYRVESLLGRGRLSAVYLARHLEHQQAAALTIFPLPEHFTAEARTRFLHRFTREAATLTMLNHRNLLPIQEYGERFGYPYLVTPHMAHGSLSDVLKKEGRLAPAQVLTVLEQVAASLEYIHRKGVVHGMLRTSNILQNEEQTLLVGGVGLATMLQLRGIELTDQPYAHLLSIADTFLYASAYIAPEIVQGQPVDARADIYALGIILFELLCGTVPFTGSSPLETALQHVQQPVPSLRELAPDIPIALELVVHHALARNPERRFQRVSELVEAFSQVCHGLVSRLRIQRDQNDTSTSLQTPHISPVLAIPTGQKSIHDAPEEEIAIGNWQLKPPIITGKVATIRPAIAAGDNNAVGSGDAWQILPPIVTGRHAAIKPATPKRDMPDAQPVRETYGTRQPVQPQPVRATEPLASSQPVAIPLPSAPSAPPAPPAHTVRVRQPEPFASPPAPAMPVSAQPRIQASPVRETSPAPLRLSSQADALGAPTLSELTLSSPQRGKRARGGNGGRGGNSGRRMSRRSVVALLATGGVAAAGALVALDLGMMHTNAQPMATTTHQQGAGNAGTTKTTAKTGTTTKKPGGGTTNAGHTGKVVGQTNLAANSSLIFTNPADGKASLLIHLPGGAFVAYESACTHEGVTVHYDPNTHTIVCPAHNAIFDPAHGAKVLQGPAVTPLANVNVRVNADGTITTA